MSCEKSECRGVEGILLFCFRNSHRAFFGNMMTHDIIFAANFNSRSVLVARTDAKLLLFAWCFHLLTYLFPWVAVRIIVILQVFALSGAPHGRFTKIVCRNSHNKSFACEMKNSELNEREYSQSSCEIFKVYLLELRAMWCAIHQWQLSSTVKHLFLAQPV